MRLDKFLSDSGIGTRSEVKKFIKDGRITVDGQKVLQPATQIDEANDGICLDDAPVNYQKFVYYMFHKPAGCVCATTDQNHPTIFSYVPQDKKGDLFSVGRLDLDTEGLLLVTNDGAFAHRLLSPRRHVKKTYFVRLSHGVSLDDTKRIRDGVSLHDQKNDVTGELLPQNEAADEVLLTIDEGRYHQVKEMMRAIGNEVLYLKRISMGAFVLDDALVAGTYRTLTEKEMEYVRKYRSGDF